VVAADVYASAPHVGRGGWTWYTGSAGWMYRLIIESFLGLKKEGGKLKFSPCIPQEWESFKIHYKFFTTIYHLLVIQKSGEQKMTVIVDGINQDDKTISLVDDGIEHHVQIEIYTDLLRAAEMKLELK
jgi:cyclic beta-1,2-glucan synthetase